MPIPKTALYALLAALACALLLAGWQWREATVAQAETAKIGRTFSDYKAQQERESKEALAKLRDDELQTRKEIQGALDEEHTRRLAAEASLRRADAAGRSLRDELSATRAYLAQLDTRTPEGCAAAAETASVCTGLLEQCSGRRRELAEFAEGAAGAGQLCQQTYGALK